MRLNLKIRHLLEKRGVYFYRVGKEQFFTFWTRPKKASDVYVQTEMVSEQDTAIIVQGPIRYEDDFTLETVKLYRSLFPSCGIIVSTWSNEDKDTLEQMEKMGAVVCVSDLPEVRKGLDISINLQRKNTRRGIIEAQKLGYRYVAKTRSDQRIYAPRAIQFCRQLVKNTPLRLNNVQAEGRIVSTSLGTFTNRFYNVSDLFLFGYTEDILCYYSCPEDLREKKNEAVPQDLLEYSKRRTGEVYFASHYIEKQGFTLKWTKEDNDFFMKELFIIIDAETIDLFWPKYSKEEYRWRFYQQYKLKQMTFSDWYMLYIENGESKE